MRTELCGIVRRVVLACAFAVCFGLTIVARGLGAALDLGAGRLRDHRDGGHGRLALAHQPQRGWQVITTVCTRFFSRLRFHGGGAVFRADVRRTLVLRTASNFAMPPPGQTAGEFYWRDRSERGALLEGASPFEASLETAWVLTDRVATELVSDWQRRFRDETFD